MPLSIRLAQEGVWRGFGEVNQTDPPVESGVYEFSSSSVEGGGFQNAIAVSPFVDSNGRRPYLLGADVSGPFRSMDRGALWIPVDNGSASNNQRIATFMWDDSTPGKAWFAEDGGIHRSTNWGETWSKRPAAADWDANNAVGGEEHPRQTGFVLAQDNSTATKYLWAGTLSLGLRQSIDDAATWRATVLAGHPIRSIALDPNNRDQMYVCVNRGTAAQNGVWRVTGARSTTMTATKLTAYPGTLASPVGPEEVIAVNAGGTTQVYVAGHEAGMFRFTPSTSTWTTINSGLAVNGSAAYRAVCVDPTNANVIYCGHWRPASRQAIYRSTNGGTTWSSITGTAANPPVTAPATGSVVVDWNMFGTSTRSWLADIPYHSFAGPSADWLPAMLAVDPDFPNRCLMAGRGGAWFGTLSNGTWTWQPSVHGLLVTVCMSLAVDDLNDGRVVMGNMDYTHFYSTDALANSRQAKHPDSDSTGRDCTFDMAATSGQPAVFYAHGPAWKGSGPKGSGGVYSSATPELYTGTHWVNESGAAWDGDCVAVAVGRNSSSQRVILAAVAQQAGSSVGGLWRKVGTTWTQYRNPATHPSAVSHTNQASNETVMRWRRDSPTVYSLEGDGLWRSDDAGLTWTIILTGVNATYGTADAICLDPLDVAKVYVSSGGVVRRIDNASTTTGTGTTNSTVIWASGSGTAGNIAVRANGADMLINIRDGRLMRSTTGLFRTAVNQAGCTWTDVATPFFRNASGNIRSLAVTPGGVVLTADNGSGALRGVQV